jgi:hypothetical protein
MNELAAVAQTLPDEYGPEGTKIVESHRKGKKRVQILQKKSPGSVAASSINGVQMHLPFLGVPAAVAHENRWPTMEDLEMTDIGGKHPTLH